DAELGHVASARAALVREVRARDAHLVQIGVPGKPAERRDVVFPAESRDAGGAELAHGLDRAANGRRLGVGDRGERRVGDGLDEAEAEERGRLALRGAVVPGPEALAGRIADGKRRGERRARRLLFLAGGFLTARVADLAAERGRLDAGREDRHPALVLR